MFKFDLNNICLLCLKCYVIEENEVDEKKVFLFYFKKWSFFIKFDLNFLLGDRVGGSYVCC